MQKKIAPPTEYIAPEAEVLEIVVEQPVFQVSYGEYGKPGNPFGPDQDGGIF